MDRNDAMLAAWDKGTPVLGNYQKLARMNPTEMEAALNDRDCGLRSSPEYLALENPRAGAA